MHLSIEHFICVVKIECRFLLLLLRKYRKSIADYLERLFDQLLSIKHLQLNAFFSRRIGGEVALFLSLLDVTNFPKWFTDTVGL
jgi:hypothetical protein